MLLYDLFKNSYIVATLIAYSLEPNKSPVKLTGLPFYD